MMAHKKIEDCIERANGGIYIDLKVKPKSSENSIEGINRWRNNIEVKIEAKAKDGEANKELISFFSRELAISKNKIKIVKGKRSDKKRLFIKSGNMGSILSRLS